MSVRSWNASASEIRSRLPNTSGARSTASRLAPHTVPRMLSPSWIGNAKKVRMPSCSAPMLPGKSVVTSDEPGVPLRKDRRHIESDHCTVEPSATSRSPLFSATRTSWRCSAQSMCVTKLVSSPVKRWTRSKRGRASRSKPSKSGSPMRLPATPRSCSFVLPAGRRGATARRRMAAGFGGFARIASTGSGDQAAGALPGHDPQLRCHGRSGGDGAKGERLRVDLGLVTAALQC